jgi:hypothetical protein
MNEDVLARRVRSAFEDGYEPPSGGFEARMRTSLQTSPERAARPGWALELAAPTIAILVISVLTLGRLAIAHSPSGSGLVTHSPDPTINVVSTPCTSVTASATPATPTGPGITVAITGSAMSCPNPLYKFWVLYPGSSTWKLAQSYSANSATYNWDTSSKPPGVYHFSIWARDAGSNGTSSNSLGSWDAYTTLQYTLPVWPYTPCPTANERYSPSPPQVSGTRVDWVFFVDNFACPNPRFQLWILAPGKSWQVVQAYSASDRYSWDTLGLFAGDYYFAVWSRDASSPGAYSSSLGSWDAYTTVRYTLTSVPCSSVSASSTPTSPQAVGTPVVVTGFAFGCPHPDYEFWVLAPGSTIWHLAQSFSTSATFDWSTVGRAAGTYRFSVWTRDASSTGRAGNSLGTWDATTAISYTLT